MKKDISGVFNLRAGSEVWALVLSRSELFEKCWKSFGAHISVLSSHFNLC